MSHLSASQASVCSVKEDELPIGLFKLNSKSKIITVLLYTEAKTQVWGAIYSLELATVPLLLPLCSNCFLPLETCLPQYQTAMLHHIFLVSLKDHSRISWLAAIFYLGIPIAGYFTAKSTFYMAEIIGQRFFILNSYTSQNLKCFSRSLSLKPLSEDFTLTK